ncbi:MAG: hypothetical protein ACREPG_07780, partial [Candidatus Binatia bacterium]
VRKREVNAFRYHDARSQRRGIPRSIVDVPTLADVHRADFRHQDLSRGIVAPAHDGTVRQQNVLVRRQRLELILIDSGLVTKAGHSYTLAKTVSDALARRKLRYRIFGLTGLDTSIAAEIGAISHFSRSLCRLPR